jgi:diguanylate cyclase (GGDEF)-like protein
MSTRLRLRSLMLVAVSGALAALIVLFTGDLGSYWPLLGLPIIIAAITHKVPGALVVSAAVIAGVALLWLGGSESLDPTQAPGLLVGLGVFAVCGLIVGRWAELFERKAGELEQAAVVDELTGLYDRNYLEERLVEEVGRADRYGASVGLAVFDVDDLRSFNDTFGHYRADLMLRHLADVIKLTTRESDVVTRLEGGTFAVLFMQTATEQVVIAAERVRAAVEKAEFEGDELEPSTKRTVSAGVASYPDWAGDGAGMLETAQEALRAAKEQGKNTVVAPAGITS